MKKKMSFFGDLFIKQTGHERTQSRSQSFVPLDQRSEKRELWEQPFQACAIA